jgi:L-2-hydroxyglutarate oxidase LhgO
MLYAYCTERAVAHRRCGKLIVANTPSQVAALPQVLDKAQANGVHDLRLLSRAEAQALEPQLDCVQALLSPSTGIVDSHGLMLSLQGDLEHAGGLLVFHSTVQALRPHAEGVDVETQDGTVLRAASVVNAAGLHACALARRTRGLDAAHVPTPRYAKGSYFTLSGRSPFERLIYPAPDPAAHLAGLGVHLTIDLGGQAKFGPDVQWTDDPDDLVVDPARAQAFYAEVRRYWPALPDGALSPGYAGMRPKISGPDQPAADFRIDGPEHHGVPGLVNLFGIESPGLTSCLAIGQAVVARL